MEKMHRQGVWGGAGGFHTLLRCPTLPAPPPIQKLSEPHSFGFLWWSH